MQLQVILSNSEVNKGKMDHKKSRKIYFVLRYSGASKSPRVVSQCHVGEARICEVLRFRDCDCVLETYIDKRRDRTSELVSYRGSSPRKESIMKTLIEQQRNSHRDSQRRVWSLGAAAIIVAFSYPPGMAIDDLNGSTSVSH